MPGRDEEQAAYVLEDQRRMSLARNYFAWQTRLARPFLGRRVIEVGSGIGNFTGGILDRELVLALEVEPTCRDEIARRYQGRANLRVFPFDIERDSLLELACFEPDSCVCLNVLEHIGNDGSALRGMAAVLPPGGHVVLIVPAFPALFGPIDRRLEHYRRYTLRGLRELATGAGFEVEKLRYMNFVGFFGWWVNAHWLRRREQSAAQILLFDRALVPVLSRLEEVLAPPFGQSLFAVLRKPAR